MKGIAKEGDTIKWTCPQEWDKCGDPTMIAVAGKEITARVAGVFHKDKCYCVYVDYCGGQDMIPFDKAQIVTKI